MSVRVVNPFTLTEMGRLREAVVARPTFRPTPEARARVARNLWGCAGGAESRSFVSRELDAQRERAAERWGFDFAREAPRTEGPGAERYAWEPARTGTVPRAYRMPRLEQRLRPLGPLAQPLAARLRLEAVLETARATTAVPARPARKEPLEAVTAAASSATPDVAEPAASAAATVPLALASPDMASPPSCSPVATVLPAATRQTTMKEFMVCRKRSLDRKDTSTSSSNPAKRARTESSL